MVQCAGFIRFGPLPAGTGCFADGGTRLHPEIAGSFQSMILLKPKIGLSAFLMEVGARDYCDLVNGGDAGFLFDHLHDDF